MKLLFWAGNLSLFGLYARWGVWCLAVVVWYGEVALYLHCTIRDISHCVAQCNPEGFGSLVGVS
jgi:hypothetical protein